MKRRITPMYDKAVVEISLVVMTYGKNILSYTIALSTIIVKGNRVLFFITQNLCHPTVQY